jgi:hypothetical protein
MSSGTTPPLPGPKTVAGWWTRFAPDATALLAGTFPVTRVELGVRDTEPAPPDPLLAAVLRVLHAVGPGTAADLDRALHIGEARVEAALRDAVDRNLADPAVRRVWTPRPGPAPSPPAARAVVRRVTLAVRDGVPLEPVGPLDLAPPETFGWRAVPVHATEPLTAVVTRTRADGVACFPAGPDWDLPAGPRFALPPPGAAAAFPELFADPPAADVRAAWLGWAKGRSVPADEAANCPVALGGVKLEVTAPPSLIAWLRANRADVFRGDTWVWVGPGPLRRAAVLDVKE